MGTTTLVLTREQTEFVHAVTSACRKYIGNKGVDYDALRAEVAKDLYVRMVLDKGLLPDVAAEKAVSYANKLIVALKN